MIKNLLTHRNANAINVFMRAKNNINTPDFSANASYGLACPLLLGGGFISPNSSTKKTFVQCQKTQDSRNERIYILSAAVTNEGGISQW